MSNILDHIKLSGTTYDLIDSTAIHSLDGYWTSGQTESAITAATAALAETIGEELSAKTDESAFTSHTSDTVAHTTQAEKDAWDAKLDANAVSGYADSVKYNSTTKYVEFYHNGTGGTKVFEYDASPFLIDGMVQNVEIKDVTISGESVTCLVISFNTDAGKQDINIPISDIFNADNYYQKSEIDGIVSGINDDISAVSGDVSTLSGTVTAHTADTTIHTTSSEKETWNGKQDALVNQVNIKSINGTSLLGSGDLQVQSLPTVSGSTLVFS